MVHVCTLLVLTANVLRLDKLRGNGPFDRHLSKPTDMDAFVRIFRGRLAEVR